MTTLHHRHLFRVVEKEERRDSLGRRYCTDDNTGKRIPCNKLPAGGQKPQGTSGGAAKPAPKKPKVGRSSGGERAKVAEQALAQAVADIQSGRGLAEATFDAVGDLRELSKARLPALKKTLKALGGKPTGNKALIAAQVADAFAMKVYAQRQAENSKLKPPPPEELAERERKSQELFDFEDPPQPSDGFLDNVDMSEQEFDRRMDEAGLNLNRSQRPEQRRGAFWKAVGKAVFGLVRGAAVAGVAAGTTKILGNMDGVSAIEAMLSGGAMAGGAAMLLFPEVVGKVTRKITEAVAMPEGEGKKALGDDSLQVYEIVLQDRLAQIDRNSLQGRIISSLLKDPTSLKAFAAKLGGGKKTEAKKVQKSADNPYNSLCPVCGEPAKGSCRCMLGNKFCKNGHDWHHCPVHKGVILPGTGHGDPRGFGCHCGRQKSVEKGKKRKDLDFLGVPLVIEYEPGDVREGKGWKRKMNCYYGRIKHTRGKDGDGVDFFLSPDYQSGFGGLVFVVNQIDQDGNFDEHKVLLGFPDYQTAVDCYLANYPKGWKMFETVKVLSIPELKAWLERGDKSVPKRMGGRIKSHLPFIKGSGPCKPGQNPARDGCTAADGHSGPGPSANQSKPGSADGSLLSLSGDSVVVADSVSQALDEASGLIDKFWDTYANTRAPKHEREDAAAEKLGYKSAAALFAEARSALDADPEVAAAVAKLGDVLREDFFGEDYGASAYRDLAEGSSKGAAGIIRALAEKKLPEPTTLIRVDTSVPDDLSVGADFNFDIPKAFTTHSSAGVYEGIKVVIEGAVNGTKVSAISQYGKEGEVFSYHPDGYVVTDKYEDDETGRLTYVMRPKDGEKTAPRKGLQNPPRSVITSPGSPIGGKSPSPPRIDSGASGRVSAAPRNTTPAGFRKKGRSRISTPLTRIIGKRNAATILKGDLEGQPCTAGHTQERDGCIPAGGAGGGKTEAASRVTDRTEAQPKPKAPKSPKPAPVLTNGDLQDLPSGRGPDRFEGHPTAKAPAAKETVDKMLGSPTVQKWLDKSKTREVLNQGNYDQFLGDLMTDLGYDGPPEVVTAEDLDRLVADGHTLCYRGYENHTHADQFRSGDLFVGKGVIGNGYYAAFDHPPSGEQMAGDNPRYRDNPALEMADNYADTVVNPDNVGKGVVTRLVVDKSASLITYREAAQARDEFVAEIDDRIKKLGNTFFSKEKSELKRKLRLLRGAVDGQRPLSRFVIHTGADAIVDPDEGVISILNRTKVKVEDVNYQQHGPAKGKS